MSTTVPRIKARRYYRIRAYNLQNEPIIGEVVRVTGHEDLTHPEWRDHEGVVHPSWTERWCRMRYQEDDRARALVHPNSLIEVHQTPAYRPTHWTRAGREVL